MMLLLLFTIWNFISIWNIVNMTNKIELDANNNIK